MIPDKDHENIYGCKPCPFLEGNDGCKITADDCNVKPDKYDECGLRTDKNEMP